MKNNKKISSPLVSVLMPMHNEAKYIEEAVASILNQTFTDFEFIIVDDGSTDNCGALVQAYEDERIIYVKNEKNIGISNTMNKGLSMARGKYLIRMDADDISLPNRIARQVAYMEAHPEVGICGTYLRLFGAKNGVWIYRQKDEELKPQFLSGMPIANATMITRKSVLSKLETWYNPEMDSAEDYDLTERLSHHVTFANIPEIHYHYRIHTSNSHLFSPNKLFDISMEIRMRNMESQLKRKLSPVEKNILLKALNQKEKALDANELLYFHHILLDIYKALERKLDCSKKVYHPLLVSWWVNQIKKQKNLQIASLFFIFPPLRLHWAMLIYKLKWLTLALPKRLYLLVSNWKK